MLGEGLGGLGDEVRTDDPKERILKSEGQVWVVSQRVVRTDDPKERILKYTPNRNDLMSFIVRTDDPKERILKLDI